MTQFCQCDKNAEVMTGSSGFITSVKTDGFCCSEFGCKLVFVELKVHLNYQNNFFYLQWLGTKTVMDQSTNVFIIFTISSCALYL